MREKYWRYSLIVLILGLGVVIFLELTPFLGGALGAVTIYVLLRRQMLWLTGVRHWRRPLAATLLLAETVFLFLLPMSGFVWMVVAHIRDFSLDPQSIVDTMRDLAERLNDRTGYDILQFANIQSFTSELPNLGQRLVRGIIDFAVNLLVLLFVLYFMLVGGRRMEAYVRVLLPFNHTLSQGVMGDVYRIVRSNAIGIPLLAVVQGVVAYVGYLIFGVESALFWGVITCLATIIPIIGTALVWLPLALVMMAGHEWGNAAGLVLYGGIVVANTDNLVRFLLQRRLADTHPLVTIFGVVVGLSLFGFIGVVFGPLLLEMFIFVVDLFKRCYLEDKGFCEIRQRRGAEN